MSTNRYNQVLSINIKSSLSKQLLILLPHLVVLVILISVIEFKGLTYFYLLLSLFCIAISVIYFVRLHLTFSSNKSINKIHINQNGNWSVFFKDDVKDNVLLSATSYTSNILIILNFKDSFEKYYTALITPDSVNKDEFRKLKVLIKTQKLVI